MPTASEIKAAFPGYAGWNDEASIVADYNNTGGAGKGGGSGGGGGGAPVIDVNTIIQNAINAVTALVPKAPKPYEEVNPFSFDEALAKEASTKEYAPYYDELLKDYVSTVETKKARSSEDLKTTLDQLAAGKEYYMGAERRALDKAVKSTNEGYAGRGLFFSGLRPKDVTDLQKESDIQTANYADQYKYNVNNTQTAYKRGGEDLTTALSQYTRDTERQKDTSIIGGVQQRKQEARDTYEMSRQKYYDNSMTGTYNTGGTNA